MLLLTLNILFVLVAIAMIALILMQRGAGASAGSGFGGGASSTVFGARGSANFLSKATKWLAIAFFAYGSLYVRAFLSGCRVPLPTLIGMRLRGVNPATIVDAGAYTGFSAIYFAEKYPAAKVLALEPDPSNFALLVRNARPYSNIVPLQQALWSRDGSLELQDPGTGHWGFYVAPGEEPASGSRARVEAVSGAYAPGPDPAPASSSQKTPSSRSSWSMPRVPFGSSIAKLSVISSLRQCGSSPLALTTSWMAPLIAARGDTTSMSSWSRCPSLCDRNVTPKNTIH